MLLLYSVLAYSYKQYRINAVMFSILADHVAETLKL